MLTTSASIGLGVAFIMLAGINVWLVLEAWARVKAAKTSSRMLALHRIGGYLFIGLFFVMAYFMVARLRNGGTDTSPTVSIHLALAMILSPLLFIKVLIARYYKTQQGLLMPIGLSIFVLAFVLIASTAGPFLARVSKIEQVSIDPGRVPPVRIDLNQASALMQKRCSKCHNLDRVVGARKDARGWLATVSRMRSMPGAGISETEAQTIVSGLASQNRPEGSDKVAQMEVARALVDQRCGRCHTLDRVYKTVQSPEQWRETVSRMVDYAAGSTGALQPGEDEQIVDYLSATQTPAAATQRKAQAAALPAGRSLIGQKAALSPIPSAPPSRFDGKTIGFVSVVCLAVVTLVVRRPGPRAWAATKPTMQLQAAGAGASRSSNAPFLLQLVQITQQTPDSKTLRFAVSGPRKPDALPGQFLTFSFLFDGKKVTRCYSICSSPARSGYVEITPKRLSNGCVSMFLNDRAPIGMTVEAAGPFGQFCLNPADRDNGLVLVAAGSGITPMMAMLRYIGDLCLETPATLLYCVRTSRDIIFHDELTELEKRLKNFRYHLLLSQPDTEWPGARGHISGDFICKAVPKIDDQVFFLCGPLPFMRTAFGILTGLGVAPERIRQETFGNSGVELKPLESRAAETGFTVEFARSGRTAAIPEGRTLLDIAAENGIDIPSACRQGQCGTCKTRLLNGHVHMTAEQGLDPESKIQGFVLTCVGHAEGDVKLDA